MFDEDDPAEEDIPSSQIPQKKRKLNSCEVVHSSLGYESFKAPPLVEYKSIDSYCEKKLGKSLLPSVNGSPSASHNTLSSISSPIVLKNPNQSGPRLSGSNDNYAPPYSFFSVEELSVITSLNHWSNTKVCPVGRVELDLSTQECYLHSVLEKGSWRLLLDTSGLKEIPKIKTPLQIFGCMEVNEGKPILTVDFYRDLRSTDLTLFVKSYRMMQKYVPDFLNLQKDEFRQPKVQSPVDKSGFGCQLNDTLDDYNMSSVEMLACKEGGEQADKTS